MSKAGRPSGGPYRQQKASPVDVRQVLSRADRVVPRGLFVATFAPGWTLTHPNLKATEKLLLATLLGYGSDDVDLRGPARESSQSASTLADEVGVHVRSVRRTLNALESRGFLQRRRRCGASSVYRVHIPEAGRNPWRGRVWYPRWILRHRALTSFQKLVYGAIGQRIGADGTATVSYEEVARAVGGHRSAVITATTRLVAMGLLDKMANEQGPNSWAAKPVVDMADSLRRDVVLVLSVQELESGENLRVVRAGTDEDVPNEPRAGG